MTNEIHRRKEKKARINLKERSIQRTYCLVALFCLILPAVY